MYIYDLCRYTMSSKKHHYLPEFYLKGFVNNSGQFSVFDYQKGHIKKGEYSPSTHFFERDRNSIEFEGHKSDFPEQNYSEKDNWFSSLFKVIQASAGIPKLDTTQMLTLQDFVSNIFWRIPKNDKMFNAEFQSNPLFTQAFKFRNKATGEEVNNGITEKIKSSDAFRTAFRVTASDLTFMAHNSDDLNNWSISYGGGDFHLCSDNPLILRDENAKDIFKTEFIFPLTKSHLLIRTFSDLTQRILTPQFGVTTDITIFKQGEIYCAGARRDFLNTISSMAPNFEISILKGDLFSFLDRSANG